MGAVPGLGPASRVVDVGSGTGCLIPHLQASWGGGLGLDNINLSSKPVALPLNLLSHPPGQGRHRHPCGGSIGEHAEGSGPEAPTTGWSPRKQPGWVLLATLSRVARGGRARNGPFFETWPLWHALLCGVPANIYFTPSQALLAAEDLSIFIAQPRNLRARHVPVFEAGSPWYSSLCAPVHIHCTTLPLSVLQVCALGVVTWRISQTSRAPSTPSSSTGSSATCIHR